MNTAQPGSVERGRARAWLRDRSLGVLFFTLFLLTWIGQLVVQWFEFVDDAQAQGQAAVFWSSEFWATFGQATFENWQSEFLQLGSFVIAGAYLVYKGSSESGDGEQRIEAKLDRLLRESGLDPVEVEEALPARFRSRSS